MCVPFRRGLEWIGTWHLAGGSLPKAEYHPLPRVSRPMQRVHRGELRSQFDGGIGIQYQLHVGATINASSGDRDEHRLPCQRARLLDLAIEGLIRLQFMRVRDQLLHRVRFGNARTHIWLPSSGRQVHLNVDSVPRGKQLIEFPPGLSGRSAKVDTDFGAAKSSRCECLESRAARCGPGHEAKLSRWLL